MLPPQAFDKMVAADLIRKRRSYAPLLAALGEEGPSRIEDAFRVFADSQKHEVHPFARLWKPSTLNPIPKHSTPSQTCKSRPLNSTLQTLSTPQALHPERPSWKIHV